MQTQYLILQNVMLWPMHWVICRNVDIATKVVLWQPVGTHIARWKAVMSPCVNDTFCW